MRDPRNREDTSIGSLDDELFKAVVVASLGRREKQQRPTATRESNGRPARTLVKRQTRLLRAMFR